jgi:hypothetical protein
MKIPTHESKISDQQKSRISVFHTEKLFVVILIS